MEESCEEQPPLPRRPRLRIANACQFCRSRKVKCDGTRPDCSCCLERRKKCVYQDEPLKTRRHIKRYSKIRRESPGSRHEISHTEPGMHSTQAHDGFDSTGISYASRDLNRNQIPDHSQDRAYYTPHGQFVGEVTAAADDRVGVTVPLASNYVPFVDAPLFGDLDLSLPRNADLNKEVPPRAYADRLIGVYWQHIHSIEPVLNEEDFLRDYNEIYNAPFGAGNHDGPIQLSILNLVFALAVQRQELSQPEQRDQEANGFFRRAWALLPPDKILWEPGSLELVQCLMLINRYLHCTSNKQQTRMTAALAVRIAQDLHCHRSYETSFSEPPKQRKLKQQIWTSCVGLNRCVSWSLGTVSAPFPVLSLHREHSSESISRISDLSHQEIAGNLYLELYEIGNQIQLAQTQTHNAFAAKLGVPHPYHQEEYHTIAIKLEACLDRWENKLPHHWKWQNLDQLIHSETRNLMNISGSISSRFSNTERICDP